MGGDAALSKIKESGSNHLMCGDGNLNAEFENKGLIIFLIKIYKIIQIRIYWKKI